ncbi:MAG: hypothetical protein ABTQ29_10925 [Siculibacillus sp.]
MELLRFLKPIVHHKDDDFEAMRGGAVEGGGRGSERLRPPPCFD